MKTLATLHTSARWPRPWSLRLQFDARDLWLGLFWYLGELRRVEERGLFRHYRALHVYVCVVPMLPLHLLVWLPR